MKVATWNGRLMGSSERRKYSREMMHDHDLDFIGIQETQLEAIRESWLDQIGSRQDFYWHVLPSNGRSGVILVGFKLDKFIS